VPEGDAVWYTARALHRALAGQLLTGSDFRVPKLATADLTGWSVLESACRGKHLLLRLTHIEDNKRLTLHSHLRMDGSWRTYEPGARWGPAHLIRVVLRTESTIAVGYHLHDLALVPTEREAELVGYLGPDLLAEGEDWDRAEAVARLRRDPARTIGEALLDQRNVAGIGTIYRAETLFLRGVHPWTPVGEVADLERLLDLARRLLMANRDRPGQVTTGDTRRGRQQWVYGRANEACRRCGTRIQRGSMGPDTQERVVYWCPRCQPERTAT
jgi:endonuclease VIII